MESNSDPASGRSGLIRWIKLNFFFQKRAQRILESIIRLSKLVTIDKGLDLGRLGEIDEESLQLVNKNLKKIFHLEE